MKKIQRILMAFALLLGVAACSTKEEEPQDFWAATIAALDDKLESNQYNEGHWQIGMQDPNGVKDIAHRTLTIRQIKKTGTVEETSMFSLKNENDKKFIAYIYKISERQDEIQYDHTVTIESTDAEYKKYTVNYSEQEFRYENYYDGKDAAGELTVQDDGSITYDNVPYLKDTMEHCQTLLDDFQKEFNISYKDFNFESLPEKAVSLNIPEVRVISEETSGVKAFYSEPRINARGFSLITSLEVTNDMTTAELGEYNVERKSYDSRVQLTLEKRNLDNCYNLMQIGDPEVSYAVYVDGDSAYLYRQATSDEEIEQDVQKHAGSKASFILKTTNESYQ